MAALSVLLPVAADTASSDFSRAFKSIQEQTIEPAEILLVTNQSLPRPLEASIKEVVDANNPVRHEHFPNAPGLGGVLQAGLKVCSEPIVARMDADDICQPTRFEVQLEVLSTTDVDVVGSHLAEFETDPNHPMRTRTVPLTHEGVAEWMPWRCPLNHPTVMFDREAVLGAGGYRDFPMMEDWDIWARCLAAGLHFWNLDQALVRAQVSDLSGRRGGLDYALSEVRMARQLRELGIAKRRDTLKHLSLRVPPRLFPASVRGAIYARFAR